MNLLEYCAMKAVYDRPSARWQSWCQNEQVQRECKFQCCQLSSVLIPISRFSEGVDLIFVLLMTEKETPQLTIKTTQDGQAVADW